ncbi:MAG: methyltransferase domain-containing protein [Acidobacteria bacterium]|nr:methyltransferase domain-containing protein [Acidobacteriota bacterium]
MRRVSACMVFLLLIMTSAAARPQPAPDDKVWADFVGWLHTMPPITQVVSVLKLYGKELAGKGVTREDAKLTMDRVLRMMRDRPDAWRPIFNRIYTTSGTTFNPEPTPLLVRAVEGHTPGRALDVGMGQGRNAVFLAMKGWNVTGIDLAEEGLAAARAQATRAGTSVNALLADAATFDYGREAWDLIVITYGPGFTGDPPFAERLKTALRPGGLLVVERRSWESRPTPSRGAGSSMAITSSSTTSSCATRSS